MMHKLISAAFVASLLCTAAMADETDKDKSQSADATFKALDRNTDGRLSQNEAANDPTVSQHFSMLDADSDGYVSKREFASHEKQEKRNKQY